MAKVGFENPSRRRVRVLDTLRGIAVVYMLFFHTLFDLAVMFGLDWARSLLTSQDGVSVYFTGAFFMLAGVTICFSRDPAARGARLLCIAAGFTLVTAVIFPGSAIYFGALHLISISMLVYSVLRRVFDRIPWWLSVLVLSLLFAVTYGVPDGYFGIKGIFTVDVPSVLTENNMLAMFGFYGNDFTSVDHLPILPWMFLFLIGCGLGKLFQRELPDVFYHDFCPPISWLGKNSLLIYIIHQPIIFALLLVIFHF